MLGVEGYKEGWEAPDPLALGLLSLNSMDHWFSGEPWQLWNSLCTLLEGFALGLFTETFKTCFLTVPSLSYLVPQFSTSYCRAHKIHQSDNPSI